MWGPLVAGSGGLESALGGRLFSTADMVSALTERLRPLLGGRSEAAARKICSIFTDTEASLPIAPVVALLGGLHRSGIRTGVLSNGPSDSEPKMRPLLESGDVDAFVLSGKDGVGKPAPAAFALILSRLGVEASNAWFIDDDLGHVEAGRANGLTAVQFDGDADRLERELRASGLDWEGTSPKPDDGEASE